jgi:hypothetical protein
MGAAAKQKGSAKKFIKSLMKRKERISLSMRKKLNL